MTGLPVLSPTSCLWLGWPPRSAAWLFLLPARREIAWSRTPPPWPSASPSSPQWVWAPTSGHRDSVQSSDMYNVLASETNRSPSPRCVYRDKVVLCFLTRTCPSYTVPIPLWGSIPSGPLVCSGGTGHTAGALSAHVTWQEKLHTAETMKAQQISESNGNRRKHPMDQQSKLFLLSFFFLFPLTFTGATLTYEPHHEGGAAVTLGGRVEGLHHKLMCFGLRRKRHKQSWMTNKERFVFVQTYNQKIKRTYLGWGASDAAVPSGAHGGGLDWTGRVVYQLHDRTHTVFLPVLNQHQHCSLFPGIHISFWRGSPIRIRGQGGLTCFIIFNRSLTSQCVLFELESAEATMLLLFFVVLLAFLRNRVTCDAPDLTSLTASGLWLPVWSWTLAENPHLTGH